MVRRKSWPMDDALTKASKNMNRAMYGNSRRKGNVHHHYHSSRRTGPQHVIHEDYESYRNECIDLYLKSILKYDILKNISEMFYELICSYKLLIYLIKIEIKLI